MTSKRFLLAPCFSSRGRTLIPESSEDAYKLAAKPKELYIVPGAGHADLYDRLNYIPFDKLTTFFTKYLK